jgi:hypothetical protein
MLVCDATLDQEIFAGAGNIIKNEVLFRIRVHPLSRVGALSAAKLRELVAQMRAYALTSSLEKAFVLKQHWLAHTKRICPRCDIPFHKAHLGKTQRRSFFASNAEAVPAALTPARSGSTRDHKEHRQRLDDGDAEDVAVGLAVRQAGDRQQRDDRAVVRQRVHAAAGHGHHAVHHFSGICAACAAWMNWSDMAASAMLMPPDAEPVMPASEVTDTAAFTSGLGTLRSASLTDRKPGSAAITPPKPYSEAVFMAASSAPPTAALVPSAKVADAAEGGGHGQQDAQQQRPSTAQMPITDLIGSVTGACRPGKASAVSA